jgi:hypothetical protein
MAFLLVGGCTECIRIKKFFDRVSNGKFEKAEDVKEDLDLPY